MTVPPAQVQYVAAFDALFPGARQLAGAGRAADATVAVANTCKKPTGSCATVEGMNEWRGAPLPHCIQSRRRRRQWNRERAR